MKIDFYKGTQSKLPIIPLKLNGKDAFAILDSGAEQTIFDEKFVESLDDLMIDDTDIMISLRGISGSKTEPKKIARLVAEFKPEKASISIRGVMTGLPFDLAKISEKLDVEVSAIIGSDVLNDLNAKIDYENHCFIL